MQKKRIKIKIYSVKRFSSVSAEYKTRMLSTLILFIPNSSEYCRSKNKAIEI